MKAPHLAIALCAWCGLASAAETFPAPRDIGQQIIVASRPPTQEIWAGHAMPSPWLVSYDGTETWKGLLVQVSARAIWVAIPMVPFYSRQDLASPWLFHPPDAGTLARPAPLKIPGWTAWPDLPAAPDLTAIHLRFLPRGPAIRYWYFPVKIEKSAIRAWDFAGNEPGALTPLP
jgi:hypothetical protein